MSEKTQKTESIYKTIIERLCSEIKNDFLSEGASEELLKEFKLVSSDKMLII